MVYAQTLFHRIHENGAFPGAMEFVRQLPSGSFILYSGAGFAPLTGKIAKVYPDGTMAWDLKVEFQDNVEATVTSVVLDDEQNLVLSIASLSTVQGALVRMDTNGTVLWSLQFARPLSDVVLTDDGNLAVIGGASLMGPAPWDIQFYKVAYDGTVLANNRYPLNNGFVEYDTVEKTAYQLVLDASGSYFLLYTYGDRLCLMSVGPLGEFNWMKVLMDSGYPSGPAVSTHGWRMFQRADGRLLICGKVESNDPAQYLVAMDVDQGGQVIAAASYHLPQKLQLLDASLAPDSSIYMWAVHGTLGQPADHVAVHISQDLQLLDTWRCISGLYYEQMGFSADPDGGFDFLRILWDAGGGSAGHEMERMNASMSMECDIVDHPNCTSSPLIVQALDNLALSTIITQLPVAGPMLFSLRTVINEEACSTLASSHQEAIADHRAYPNPAFGSLFIPTRCRTGVLAIAMFDPVGKRVLDKTVVINSGKAVELDIRPLLPGVYMLESRSKIGAVWSERILISK